MDFINIIIIISQKWWMMQTTLKLKWSKILSCSFSRFLMKTTLKPSPFVLEQLCRLKEDWGVVHCACTVHRQVGERHCHCSKIPLLFSIKLWQSSDYLQKTQEWRNPGKKGTSFCFYSLCEVWPCFVSPRPRPTSPSADQVMCNNGVHVWMLAA